MLTFGTVSGGMVQSQAGIIPTQLATEATMFVDIVPSLSRNIGVAIVNPNHTVNSVTLTLRDENGNVAGTPANLSIAAHAQVAKFVDELFGSVTATGFRGSLRMQSTASFAVIGFRFSGPVFSTVAVAITTPVSGVPPMILTAGSNRRTARKRVQQAARPQSSSRSSRFREAGRHNSCSSITPGRRSPAGLMCSMRPEGRCPSN